MTDDVVIDASTLVDVSLNRSSESISARFRSSTLHAPSLIDYEFLAAMRRLAIADPNTVEAVVDQLPRFDIARHSAGRLATRIWSLRDTISAYDASYVALAEALGVPLMTADLKLGRAAAPYCDVI